MSGFCFSQSIDKWYKVELEKRLNPKIDTLQEKEVLLFIAKPSFVEPEYSVRVIDKANQSFLEVRLIEWLMGSATINQLIVADPINSMTPLIPLISQKE